VRADAQRNREAVLDAVDETFAPRGESVQMDEIAERAGLGVGTPTGTQTSRPRRLAITARRFEAMTSLARIAERIEDPWTAIETLLYSYLESAQPDTAFRLALLDPQEPNWDVIDAEKNAFAAIVERIVRRAVEADRLRADFRAEGFVLIPGSTSDRRRDAGHRGSLPAPPAARFTYTDQSSLPCVARGHRQLGAVTTGKPRMESTSPAGTRGASCPPHGSRSLHPARGVLRVWRG
jgi:AcrR family transcriptional regulator